MQRPIPNNIIGFNTFSSIIQLSNNVQLVINALIYGLLGIVLVACQPSPKSQHNITGETMGTTYHITYQTTQDTSQEQIKHSIDKRLAAINASMSTWDDESTISQFNRLAPHQSLPIDIDFVHVYQDAKQVYDASSGQFDPTVAPLIDLWGFGKHMTVERFQNPPSVAQIEAARSQIGFDAVELRDNRLVKTKPVKLNFSAVAKGYAVDAIATVLAGEYQINNYMVEIGGEVATNGNNPQGKPWAIAIDVPEKVNTAASTAQRKVLTVIKAHQMNMATSGNYRNFIEIEGVHYSHTIDPRTGRPVQGSAPSITVVADTTSLADAWATALSAMPYSQAMQLAQQHNIAAMFVVSQAKNLKSKPTSLPQDTTTLKTSSTQNSDWQIIYSSSMQAFLDSRTS